MRQLLRKRGICLNLNSSRSNRGLQTSRQDFAVKTFRKWIEHAGQRRAATGGGEREAEAILRFVAFGSVAGVSRYACEAGYPWPRLHGPRGTSTPLGRDAVSSSECGAL